MLLQNKNNVLIYSRSLEYKYNSENITQTHDIEDVFSDNGPIIIATPVNTLSYIGKLAQKNNFSGVVLLACKGIDSDSGLFPSEIISKMSI